MADGPKTDEKHAWRRRCPKADPFRVGVENGTENGFPRLVASTLDCD